MNHGVAGPNCQRHRLQHRWELWSGASADISGTPAIVVLADEAPHNHQTPIAPHNPAASNTQVPPVFPPAAYQAYIVSQSTQNTQLASDEIFRSTGGSTEEVIASIETEAARPNPRRRRRRSSSDGEQGELVQEQGTTRTEQRQNTKAFLGNSDLPPPGAGPQGHSSKRRRLMNKAAMRLDSNPSSSNGSQFHANGSSPTTQKNGVSAPTNGHASPTNGTVSPRQNGSSKSIAKKKASFFGHDREEITRLLIQGLDDLGYNSAANRLSQESGYEVESPTVVAFRNAIIQGQWSEAESLLFGIDSEADGGGVSISNGDWQHFGGLELAEGADPDGMRFSIREQKYLELLEKQDTGKAMMVLRHELQPLHYDRGRLDSLSR